MISGKQQWFVLSFCCNFAWYYGKFIK